MILDISLADAIALAGAEAIESVGGPQIPIRMGRVDASVEDAEFLHHSLQGSTTRSIVTTLPSAGLDSDGLRLFFRRKFTDPEWIALVGGSHGLGRHVSLLGMSKPCLKNLTRTCLEDAPVLLPFVTESVNRFDNTYFRALLDWNTNNVELGQVAFIPTDVAMVVDRGDVQTFAYDSTYFRRNFVTGYQKLVDLSATSLERY
jgi:L-ascorbate peroxidase